MAKLKISDDLQNIIKQVVLDTYYPIGKTYITMGNEDPNKTIGGTWVKISGGYIYAASKTLGQTSFYGWGTQSTTLSVDQIPSHNHTTSVTFSWGGGSAYGMSWTNGEYQGPYDNGLGAIITKNTGGGKGHTHDIATVDVFVWKRTA